MPAWTAVLVVASLILLAPMAPGQTGDQEVPVDGCRSIFEPGTYRLTQDITAQASPCLSIQASDVELDGNGSTITATSGAQVGIAVEANGTETSGVTVHDVTVSGFSAANVEVAGASDVRLEHVTARADDAAGTVGVRVVDAQRVNIVGTLAGDHAVGMSIEGATDVVIADSVASSNLEDGIEITRSSGVSVRDTQASGNGAAGLRLDRVPSARITRGASTGNAVGAAIEASPGARLSGVSLGGASSWALDVGGGDRVLLDRVGLRASTISGELRDAQLARTIVPEGPASPHVALDPHIEGVARTSAAFWNLTAHVPETAAADHEVPTLAWWRWDGTAWREVPGVNTVDVAASTVTTNASLGAVYAPVIREDVTPPRTTLEAPTGWTNRSVEIVLDARDDESGIAETSYRIDGGPWTSYDGPVLVESEGVHPVAYRSTDVAGNEETARNATIRVDLSPPETEAHLDRGAPTGDVTGPVNVTLTARDGFSGVARTLYRVDDAAWSVYQDPIRLTAPGEHTVAYRSVDAAGNREPARTLSVTLEVSGSGGSAAAGPVELLVEDDTTGADAPAEDLTRVRVVNVSDPDRVSIVLVHPDGEEETIASSPATTWSTRAYPNGYYELHAREPGGQGEPVTVASSTYLVEHARASPLEALGAIVAGVVLLAAAPAAGTLAGRVINWLRYLVKVVRRAMGIEYRERTKPYTSLRERLKREGGAALVAAGVLAAAVTIAGLPEIAWAAFLDRLPVLGAAAVVFGLVWYGGDWWIARVTGQAPRYTLLGSGLASLVVSTGLFRSPFGTPGYVDKREGLPVDPAREERFMAQRTLADLGLIASAGLVFLPVMRWASYGFGQAGLLLVVMTLATGTVPVPPLPNHAVWRRSKPAALAVFAAGIGLYVAWQLAMLPDPLIVALGLGGLVSAVSFAWRYADGATGDRSSGRAS